MGNDFLSTPVVGQQYGISPEQTQNLTPEQRKQMMEQMAKRRGRGNNNPQPEAKKEETKEDKKGDKSKEKQDEEKKEEEAKTIKRPTDKSHKLDPNRPKLQPDKNGMVQFNYNGHPWQDVLQEYADVAYLTFDCQELPADNLILTTRRKYRLDQARDLLNCLLLLRGFTLVMQGEIMMAVMTQPP